MIIKRQFRLLTVLTYVRAELLFSLAINLLVIFGIYQGISFARVGPAFVTILGGALAIFIGFRNNTSYTRWWEARTLWSQLQASSKSLVRQVIINADNAVATGKADVSQVNAFKQDVIRRQISFVWALRSTLLKQPTEHDPQMLLLDQTRAIKAAMRSEILGPFDNISLEPTMGSLVQTQTALERLRDTPLLRQYDYFTRMFLYSFMLLLPLTMLSNASAVSFWYDNVALNIFISFVYACMNKIGELNEEPFAGRSTDVPMKTICENISYELTLLNGQAEGQPGNMTGVNGYVD